VKGSSRREEMNVLKNQDQPGTREKVSLRRINLEGNTHAQESNAYQLCIAVLI
jgi:hypothetical protein